jgi:hypothetical protein
MRQFVRLLALAVLVAPATAAAAPLKSGTYELRTIAPAAESVICVVKIDVKNDGGVTGELVAEPPPPANFPDPDMFKITLKGVAFDGKNLRMTVRNFGNDQTFEGAPAADGTVVGSFGLDANMSRARLTPTEKTELKDADVDKPLNPPQEYRDAQASFRKVNQIVARARRTQDAEERKKLLKEAEEEREKALAEVAKFYGELIEKHPDTIAAAEAAVSLLRRNTAVKSAPKDPASPEQAGKWARLVVKAAEAYGPRYTREMNAQMGQLLAGRKEYAQLALSFARRAEELLTAKDSEDTQEWLLEVLVRAQRAAGQAAEADATAARVARLKEVLDADYKAKMPPFKPTAFEGRKEKGDRVVVMELFTGAQCPPCVAADLAFDGLEKTYKPTDVVFLQYHVHIPGPDPMTNPGTEGRWKYYAEMNPRKVGGVPTTLFNGQPEAGGGGPVAMAEMKYKEYRDVINKLLDEPARASVGLSARREGETVKMEAEVSNLKDPGEHLRLRFVLAEEEIRFTGSNRIRFHHMVVRDLPGGVDGFKLTQPAGKYNATVDLDALRHDLVKYLDDFVAENGPFPKPQRPLALKNLKVVALVQDDKTGEILQAARADLGGERAAK